MGVFPWKDLAGVSDITAHQLGLSEREFLGGEAALGGGFGRAHLMKRTLSKT